MQHITAQLHGVIIFGNGRRPHGGIRLPAKNSTLAYSHLYHGGMRFGMAGHAHGNNSRFGFINNRIPVIVRHIYESSIQFPDEEAPRKFVVVLVQRFKRHEICPDPRFPWVLW
jgi:hypothetical protein